MMKIIKKMITMLIQIQSIKWIASIVIFGLSTIACASNNTTNNTNDQLSLYGFLLAIILLGSFLALLALLVWSNYWIIKKKDFKLNLAGLLLPAGSIRGLLALLLTGSYVIFLLWGMVTKQTDGSMYTDLIDAFTVLVGTVVAFYFGGRLATPRSDNVGGSNLPIFSILLKENAKAPPVPLPGNKWVLVKDDDTKRNTDTPASLNEGDTVEIGGRYAPDYQVNDLPKGKSKDS